MRRFAAAVGACLAVVVLGIGARPHEDASGAIAIAWTWFGSAPPGFLAHVLPPTLGVSEFVAAFESHRIALHAGAVGVAIVLGLLTAAWLSAIALPRSIGLRLACCAVWWIALDPSIASFVATREALGARNYLDLEDLFRALGIGLLLAAAVAWRGPTRTAVGASIALAAGSDTPARESGRPGASVFLAALVGAVVPWVLSRAVLDGEPLTNDEHAYLFQARVFAHGDLTYDAAGLSEFFPARQVARSGEHLFSKYPPAHSALLAIGERIGLPELVPRLLAFLSIVLTWDVARRLGAARPSWAAWLCALSPLWLGVQSLWLSHSTSIPCSMVLVWSALAALDAASRGELAKARALTALGGLAFSIAFAARPVTALAVAAPLVLLLAIERPRGWMAIGACGVLAAAPAIGALLLTNRALTGSAFRFAYEMYAQASSPEDRFGNVTPASALATTAFNSVRLSIWFVGWIPGLLLVLLGCMGKSALSRRWVLAAIPAMLVFAYALHPFQGIPWVGPLYVSEGVPELAILGSQGLSLVSIGRGGRGVALGAGRGVARGAGRGAARGAWIATVAGSALLLFNHFALARREVESRRDAFRAVSDQGIRRGVVFVRYTSAAVAKRFPLLPPEPESELVYARDLGRRNEELLRARGTTEAWTLDPSTGTLRAWP